MFRLAPVAHAPMRQRRHAVHACRDAAFAAMRCDTLYIPYEDAEVLRDDFVYAYEKMLSAPGCSNIAERQLRPPPAPLRNAPLPPCPAPPPRRRERYALFRRPITTRFDTPFCCHALFIFRVSYFDIFHTPVA